MLHYVKHSGVM